MFDSLCPLILRYHLYDYSADGAAAGPVRVMRVRLGADFSQCEDPASMQVRDCPVTYGLWPCGLSCVPRGTLGAA